MKIDKTIITAAGVFRCCLASVACEYVDEGRDVELGDKSKCAHCNKPFTLVSGANKFDFFRTFKFLQPLSGNLNKTWPVLPFLSG